MYCSSVLDGYLSSYYSKAALESAYSYAQGAGETQFWTGGRRKQDTTNFSKDEKFEWVTWDMGFQTKSCNVVNTGYNFVEAGVVAPPLNTNNLQLVDRHQTSVSCIHSRTL